MEGITRKGRAVAGATGAGVIAFLLALWALSGEPDDRNEIGNALILGIMGGAMCWAATMRVVSGLRTSIDLAAARLAAAARNDLTSPVPKDVRRDLPNLASAMENLFGQFRSNLKNAQTLALYRSEEHTSELQSLMR